ncbi:large subunit ribosomal protein L11 [Stackebrandtia albiflava]|uniref:Large ribosomal subunit protein uL11 n=1 Tax=Stackebrandtia albiflava TaxID=406432 RepID=A0A562V0K1_9ACTN|nr:50S ribosomal protein L11 [Stackebrandtia albiflava]TWJ11439.1 large subunit ribosomal protein L11 [Stackebrandtia albiflava]
MPTRTVTIALEAGNAAVPELGKALAVTGVNIRDVKLQYDAATAGQRGEIVPVVVTVAEDRGFTLRYKTPPTSFLIKRELGRGGSATPGTDIVGELSQRQLRAVAERKLPDLNTTDLAAAMRIVAGTARSMGVRIADA